MTTCEIANGGAPVYVGKSMEIDDVEGEGADEEVAGRPAVGPGTEVPKDDETTG